MASDVRVLMIIAPEQFRDEELLVPRALFQQTGWHVDTASTQTGEAPGMLGAKENITLDLNAVQNNEYAAVVIVGGMGSPTYLWNNPQVHHIVKTAVDKKRVVSAICLSGAALANAGVLHGKKATVWEMPESLQALEKGGAHYTGEAVTIDGGIVTANGPEAAQAFGEAVITQVKQWVLSQV